MPGRTPPEDWKECARRLCAALGTLLYALEGPEKDRPPLEDAIASARAAQAEYGPLCRETNKAAAVLKDVAAAGFTGAEMEAEVRRRLEG